MYKIFKLWLRIYNNFSSGDRNAIIILACLVVVINVAIILVHNIKPKSNYDYTKFGELLDDLSAPESTPDYNRKLLFTFDPNTITSGSLDTLDLPDFVKNNLVNYRNAGGRFNYISDILKIYGMNDSILDRIKDYVVIENQFSEKKIPEVKQKKFEGIIDPSIADYDELVEFGFNRYQSNNIIKYREKGGRLSQKSDLLEIYGIDSVFYANIENHIVIDAVKGPLPIRFEELIINVELNHADTAELKKIEGIGSVFANRIIKYRDLLGGFYSISQLLEVYNFPEETYRRIEPNLAVDTLMLKKIRINFAEYSDLLRHPYLNRNQVEAVLKYRNKYGSYKNINQLKTEGLLDLETFQKVSPYLTCR